ncbi:chalcone isomerase family protein [Arsukibacterium sp.]|uniref:chalcone isomerase family protein n=1 Tax=Arsukibacterium sp. TaxID=1977258 RepID=UPI00299CFD62|nr:chalcone isomerase family protein [Arsukibacterium sp.]MDX1676291.1 chalcone isomerase family protein [Arsukibacterium sp.]
MRRLISSIVALGFAGLVAATPDLTTVGEGSYRYLFWQLYDARLASADGTFSDYQQSRPLLLELTYKREISKQEFIDATVEQWQKLDNSTAQQQQQWAERLRELWRDVEEGDQLAALLTKQGQVQFFFNGTDIGTVQDKAFAPAFFDIWLHPDTMAPDLRRKLIAAE